MELRRQTREMSVSSALPCARLLASGAVLFPGVFDQQGRPLLLFPPHRHRVTEETSGAEVERFIHYCLRLHGLQGECVLLSAVADLRQADPTLVRFMADVLQANRKVLHSIYILQPKKKEVLKQLKKRLTPRHSPAPFRCVFLKDVCELSSHVDRSQLPADLGGFHLYCHRSWVSFITEMDGFVQDFLSVVTRLPVCISALQSLSLQATPSDPESLLLFCSAHQARFLQLRSELGLDALLQKCELLMDKLRFPEKDPCFQAMAGTLLFSHTALEMLHNYRRITAAVEKVELLWHQVSSGSRLKLQVVRLERDASEIQQQMQMFFRETLRPYRVQEAGDALEADALLREFEASLYTHAMALVRRAEDVVHTLGETVGERWVTAGWAVQLERSKEALCSLVQRHRRTLRAASDFHRCRERVWHWYRLVLGERFLQERVWSRDAPGWTRAVRSFLAVNPGPELQELVTLARLSAALTEPRLRQAGEQLSQRCVTLSRILTSPDVSLHDLQFALQWQKEYLGGVGVTSPGPVPACDLARWDPGSVSSVGKPPSLSSFDSGFEGVARGAEPASGARVTHEENLLGVSDAEELRFSLDQRSARASIQILPKVTPESLNLEIRVKRCTSLPTNPWLSLPIDDLESSYVVTITPNASKSPSPSESSSHAQRRDPLELEDSELHPIGNVLSSTLTDHEEPLGVSVGGAPSLLWDTFDLHNLRLEPLERMEESVSDWALQEHQELEAVRESLGRAADILQEEEEVLAQEMAVNRLLESEDLLKAWSTSRTEPDVQQQISTDPGPAATLGGHDDEGPRAETASASSPLSLDWTELDESPGPEESSRNSDQERTASPEQLEREACEAAEGSPSGEAGIRVKLADSEAMDNSRLDSRSVRVSTALQPLSDRSEQRLCRGQECAGPAGAWPCPGVTSEPEVCRSAEGPAGLTCEASGLVQGAFDPGGVSLRPYRDQPTARSSSGVEVWTTPGHNYSNNNNNNNIIVQPTDPPDLETDVGRMRGSRLDQPRPLSRWVGDHKTPVVLDTGSGLVKAGFADQDLPSVVFPTVVGRPKYEEVMSSGVDRTLLVGREAQHMRGVLTLSRPVRNGVVRSWDELELVWRQAFRELAVRPEEHPLLVTEAAMTPRENRLRLLELMFEAFAVPLAYVAAQPVLVLYAAGRTTGVVLDSGDGVSHSVPVCEGYGLTHAVQRLDLGGADVTLQLQKLLQEQGVSLQTSAELELVREMKECVCRVALDFRAELGSAAGVCVDYTLPDGRSLSLSSETFRAPEILFRPQLIGREHYGLHESVFRSVMRSDIDLRSSLLRNIVLSGGNTLLRGLPERVEQELREMAPADLRAGLRVSCPGGRGFSVWVGGAVLASLPDLAWISAGEYEEFGPQIVFRKCF